MNFTTYSVDDLAEKFGCTVRWLTERVRSGEFPGRKIASQWRFTESDAERILALCANDFRVTEMVPKPAGGLTPRSRRQLGITAVPLFSDHIHKN